MKEQFDDDIKDYFDDNCLIEDDIYNSLKENIKCKYCNNILKEPMMCQTCQGAFCKNCIEDLDEKNHECKNPNYVKNIGAISLLGKLKYKCKNCQIEIKKKDIKDHIEKGCIRNANPTKLMDSFFRKANLRKVDSSEIAEFSARKITTNHISGKIFLLINSFLF